MTPRQELEREYNRQVRFSVWGTAAVIASAAVVVTFFILSQIKQ